MAVSDDVKPGNAPTTNTYDGAGYDRTPPQDVAAEQCVIGGMLLSKDAIADVVEILRLPDFYKPVHATIFDTILDLYGRGEPADPITVAAALTDAGEIGRVGGVPYLHTLVNMVPTAANASYYARIVAERAILRRLVEAGTRVVQLGYGAGAGAGRDVDDVVDLAQQAIYDVTEKRVSEDYSVLSDLLQPTLDEIEAIGAAGGAMTGVPTGFTDLDRLLGGLHPGQLVIVAGRPGLGKALALDTPLPTPDGWTTMGDVQVGDQLIGDDGLPTRVVAATEVMQGRPCYEVEFSDGTVIVADAEHLWRTTTRASRRQKTESSAGKHWPAESLTRLRNVCAAVTEGPDELIKFADARAELGDEFRNVLHTVGRQVGLAGRLPQAVERAGTVRNWTAPAYSRKALYTALLERAERPVNAANTAVHDGVFTTAQIAATLRTTTADRRLNHAVTNALPVQLPDRDLLIPAYTLGVWLGDGTSAGAMFTTADPEMAAHVADDGFVVRATSAQYRYAIRLPELAAVPRRLCVVCGTEFAPRATSVKTCGRSCGAKSRFISAPMPLQECVTCGVVTEGTANGSKRCAPCHSRFGSFTGMLREVGVLGDKHIPGPYLRASEAQRRALLAGLMDTDGTVAPTGNVQYTTTSARLGDDVYELIVSLGYRCTINRKAVKGRTPESSVAFTLNFTTVDNVFRLERKRSAHRERRRAATTVRTDSRFVVDVRPVASVAVRCVQVDNDRHMYLASRSMIPTHNSTIAMDFARSASVKHGLSSALFSLEMSKIEIVMRLLSAEARVPLHVLRSGQLSDDDWTKLARRMGEISEAPLFVDDTPNMTLMEIRAKARRLKQRNDLKLVCVDYLQLMSSPKKTESRQQEVAEISRGLKLLAKEIQCPVIAACQLNRGPEQRTDKRPQLSDLRESGSIEQDADVVILLHRDDYYDKESPRAGEADFIVAKHRNGPTDTITVAAQLHLSQFVDMAIV